MDPLLSTFVSQHCGIMRACCSVAPTPNKKGGSETQIRATSIVIAAAIFVGCILCRLSAFFVVGSLAVQPLLTDVAARKSTPKPGPAHSGETDQAVKDEEQKGGGGGGGVSEKL